MKNQLFGGSLAVKGVKNQLFGGSLGGGNDNNTKPSFTCTLRAHTTHTNTQKDRQRERERMNVNIVGL